MPDSLAKNDLACFGRIIKRRRTALGLSQRALASRAGLSKPFIGEIELGRRNPTLQSLIKLASALEEKLSTLIMPLDGQR